MFPRGLEKQTQSYNCISSLKNANGQYVHSDKEILDTASADAIQMFFESVVAEKQLNEEMREKCEGEFTLGECESAINKMKKNKSPGLDGINYRGIALSSMLSKLVDIIIIKKQSKHLNSSDLQFGFKEKSSTIQCSFVAEEVINYYCENGGTVYATFLDASKAFDRVMFDTLFELLLSKHLCPSLARLLSYMYTNQQCRIKWSGAVSSSFSVKNGVKQGGVLSPRLFNIYLDELLYKLKQSRFGCYYGTDFVGSLAYADDVLLLSQR